MASLCQFQQTDPFFVQQLPSAIQEATNRIDRELNLLNTVVSNSSLQTTVGTQALGFGSLNINVLVNVNIITPAGQTNPNATTATRSPCVICNQSWLNMVYGSAAVQATPAYFSMFDNQTILLGPAPDQVYNVELIGTQYPIPISVTVATNFVSLHLWDLFIAASMVFMAGAMKNFGAIADNPAQGTTWETHYETLKSSALIEDARRKFMSQGWISSQLPMQQNPPRT
jgi:hypothetical protein